MATVDPKLIIAAGLGVPILYVWLKWEWSIIFLAILGAYAWYTFDNQFIHKSEQKSFSPQLGPAEPFMPAERTWDIDPNTGEPVARYQPPPPQYPQRRYQQR